MKHAKPCIIANHVKNVYMLMNTWTCFNIFSLQIKRAFASSYDREAERLSPFFIIESQSEREPWCRYHNIFMQKHEFPLPQDTNKENSDSDIQLFLR